MLLAIRSRTQPVGTTAEAATSLGSPLDLERTSCTQMNAALRLQCPITSLLSKSGYWRLIMDLSRPEHKRDRPGRQTGRRRRQRQWGAVKASLGLVLAVAIVATPAWVWPYLRRAGVHLPAVPHPLQMAIFIVAVVFVAGQVLLLTLAISTVSKPSHDRYLDLMLHWPYVLVAPVVILKRHALPDGYFSHRGQHRSRSPEKDDRGQDRSQSTSVSLDQYRRALRLAMSQVPDSDPSPLTVEQYRRALGLAMEQLSSVTMDRDLQELLMRQLESLEQRTPPKDQW